MKPTVKRFRLIWAALSGWLLIMGPGACGSRPRTVTYQVTFDRPVPPQGWILAKVGRTGQMVPVDTVRSNPYIYNRRLPDVYFLADKERKIPLILGNASLKVHWDTTGRGHDYVTGSRENDSLYALFRRLDSLSDRQKKLFIKLRSTDPAVKAEASRAFFALDSLSSEMQYRFAEHNPNLAGVVVMTGLTFARNKTVDFKRLHDTYARYPEAVRKSEAGKYLTYRLNKLSIGQVGFKAPNFSGPTPDGGHLSLLSAMGKVTLIDFWASWCLPCRKDNPRLVALYKKYHDSGLNIIGVSLDHDKQAWLNAIRADSLDWYHISHLQGWKEPVAKQYNIRFIPQLLILDRTGTIRAKNLHGKALEEKIRQLLEE